mgnify:CR=1 FL=1
MEHGSCSRSCVGGNSTAAAAAADSSETEDSCGRLHCARVCSRAATRPPPPAAESLLAAAVLAPAVYVGGDTITINVLICSEWGK